MKKLLDILNQTPEAILEAAAVASDLGVNSNQVVPPITASENDRVGVALQKLDQIGEMVDDLYNTLSHLEEIDSDIDMSVTSAYNTVDDLYAKIDEKYDVIPIDFDGEEYGDIEESFDLEEGSDTYSLNHAQTFWYKFNGGKEKGTNFKKFQDHLMKWVRDGKVTYEKDPTFAKITNMADRYDLEFKDKSSLNVWLPKKKEDGDFVHFSTQGKFSRRGGSLFPPDVKASQIVLKEALKVPDELYKIGFRIAVPGHDTWKPSNMNVLGLYGIPMRAGKWADTFFGVTDDPNRPYSIVDADGVRSYRDLKDAIKAVRTMAKEGMELMDDSILLEVLSKDAPSSEWIDDFVNSDAPQFKGKSKKERIKMALGAYYAAQKKESVDLTEGKYTVILQKWADTQRGDVSLAKKEVEITASNDKDAHAKAKKLVPKESGSDWAWRVYDVRPIKEDLELDEKKMSPQQSFDYERYMNGAMKKDDYEKKWKLGKYKPAESNAKKLTGPGGLYKNLIHKSMREELELEESVNLSKIKELVAMSLIDEKDVAPTIAALKAAQSPEKVLTKNQISLLANLSVMLTNVILGDTAALSSVKRAAKE